MVEVAAVGAVGFIIWALLALSREVQACRLRLLSVTGLRFGSRLRQPPFGPPLVVRFGVFAEPWGWYVVLLLVYALLSSVLLQKNWKRTNGRSP